jgi:signal transduction histidine kinase
MIIAKAPQKIVFLTLILFFSLTSFILGLLIILSFQQKYLLFNKLKTSVLEAEKLSTFDQTIPLERALKIYSQNLAYAVFDENCHPTFVTDLRILSQSCLTKDDAYSWQELSRANGEKIIIGFSPQLENFLDIWKDNKLILFSTISTYLIFIFFLTILFFIVFIDSPIKKISSAIEEVLTTHSFEMKKFNVHKGHLLFNLYSTVTKLIEEIVRFQREEEKLRLSRQIAHDLRAPLSVLENLYKSNAKVESLEKMALKRIRDISDSLMPKSPTNSQYFINLDSFLHEIVTTFHQLDFEITFLQPQKSQIKLKFPEIELFRFISNILKNSLEANASKIHISINQSKNLLVLAIKDNGKGAPSSEIPNMLAGISSKIDGHGLGISNMLTKLKSIEGSLEIKTEPDKGFEIVLTMPIESFLTKSFVLIDDDKIIRLGWSNQAQKSGIDFYPFESIDQFLLNTSIPFDSEVYIDSNLKDDIRGEVESERIFQAGFTNIYLATGYSESDFNLTNFPWIKGVFSKSPPF